MKGTMHIAPCGLNCSLCYKFQSEKNNCLGCNSADENKPKYCTVCHIKHCEEQYKTEESFCYQCNKFPCKRLKAFDKRYRTKYGMSTIENLESIKAIGVAAFMEVDIKRWTCTKCGSLLCVHKDKCQICGNINAQHPNSINR